MSDDRWPELRELVGSDDQLRVREVGRWSEQKLWFWARYVDAVTTAMVGSPKWSAIVYVDLFSGPGVCQLKESDERFPGSPLIAAHSRKPFDQILLCEKDVEAADACSRRLNASPAASRFELFEGDCNERIDYLVARIPIGALTLAFVDPTGLHADMSTMSTLARNRRVDVVLLFPDAMDVARNAEAYYFHQPDSKLDRVLGADSDWRDEYGSGSADRSAVCRRFASLYRKQLAKHADYSHFGEEVIGGTRGPLYRLLFATKHPLGLDLWTKVTRKELGGQGRMF